MNAIDLFAGERELYERMLIPVQQRHRLTHMELSILLFLANNPGYDTANDLVKRRHLAKSHVSTSVRALEQKQLLKKEYRDGNFRSVHLVLLPKAGQAVADGQEQQRRFQELLTSGLTREEFTHLHSAIEKMQKNIAEALRKE